MLALRPNCEHCNCALPPDSELAMICSFECTFCRTCVDTVLKGVCPNCGGGFCQRPIRPDQDFNDGNCLANYPASSKSVWKPVNSATHAALLEKVRKAG